MQSQILVEFKGKIDKPEILTSLYKSSDVFVLPSLSEGLPTVILEALYFQLPVIATDIPGISEYFKDYTFLVTPKDEQKLAEILLKLSDEEELIKTRKKTYMGKKLVETSYSWKSIAKEYEKLYKMI